MVEKLIAELAEPQGWYCPTCRKIVPGIEVTYHEYHEVCDTKVTDAPAEPQGEPVAWTTEIALECAPHALAFEVCAGNLWGERGVPLYRRPDPRVSMLEGLLREALQGLDDVWVTFPRGQSVRERIAAALGEG